MFLHPAKRLKVIFLDFNTFYSKFTRSIAVSSSFPIVNGKIDQESSCYIKRKDIYLKYREQFKNDLTSLNLGLNKKAIDRHVLVNKKLLVRERLEALLDNHLHFIELSPLSGYDLEYGKIERAGIFCGIGRVSGCLTMILANDATVKGGAAYPITVKKQLRAQEIALESSLPCLYLIDSGGAFLPLQADIFPDEQHGGKVFYNQAIMSSLKSPQICVVCGSCTAGGAYIPTMAERTVIVNKIGTIFLGGPPLVRAATGEMVTAEDLGGANVHSSISGCTDYLAKDEKEAFSITRSIFASLNSRSLSYLDYEEPLYQLNDLGPLSIHQHNILPMYKIIARIVDGSRFDEFKALFGSTLVTGFATIKGVLVGILANHGPMSASAAAKGANFVDICKHHDIPLVFFQDTHPHIDNDPDMLKQLGKMISIVSCAQVPKITIIMGRSCGPTSYAMCSRGLQPSFLYTWPTAQIHVDNVQRRSEDVNLEERYKDKTTSFYSSANLWDDGIILPEESREVLSLSLKASMENRNLSKNELNFPVVRM